MNGIFDNGPIPPEALSDDDRDWLSTWAAKRMFHERRMRPGIAMGQTVTAGMPYTEGGPKGGQQDASQGALDMGGTIEGRAEGNGDAPEHFSDFIASVDGAISDELNDGMSLAEVLDLHGAQLDEIKKHAPDRHAELMKAYEDFEQEGNQ